MFTKKAAVSTKDKQYVIIQKERFLFPFHFFLPCISFLFESHIEIKQSTTNRAKINIATCKSSNEKIFGNATCNTMNVYKISPIK